MNRTFKQWMTHPVLLGALIGVGIGSVYLMFNANLEDENAQNPINIAISSTQSAALSLDSLDEKIQEDQGKIVLNLDDVAQPPRLLTKEEKLQLKEKAQIKEEPQNQPEVAQLVVEKVEKPAKANQDHFTIQLLGAGSEMNVKKFISHHGLESKAQYVRTKRAQKDWFVVYYGDYATMEEAKAAIAMMPTSLKKEGVAPWIRQVGSLQKDLNQVASR